MRGVRSTQCLSYAVHGSQVRTRSGDVRQNDSPTAHPAAAGLADDYHGQPYPRGQLSVPGGLPPNAHHRTPSDAGCAGGRRGRPSRHTQRWVLERWEGDADPPVLPKIWSRKPKFAVGSRSCAELAIVDSPPRDGWNGVWASTFGRMPRRDWFPAPAFRTLAEAGAPIWAAEIFDRLRAANGGKLDGFFDVFAWREPGQVRFDEVKIGPDRRTGTQRAFVERALRFHHLAEFTIIEVAASPPPAAIAAASQEWGS